jgi:hypothetical protein
MATFKTVFGMLALTSGLSLATVNPAVAPSLLGVGDGFSRVGRVIDLPAPLGATEVTEGTEFGGEVVDPLAAPSLSGVGDGFSPVDGSAGSRTIWYVDDIRASSRFGRTVRCWPTARGMRSAISAG